MSFSSTISSLSFFARFAAGWACTGCSSCLPRTDGRGGYCWAWGWAWGRGFVAACSVALLWPAGALDTAMQHNLSVSIQFCSSLFLRLRWCGKYLRAHKQYENAYPRKKQLCCRGCVVLSADMLKTMASHGEHSMNSTVAMAISIGVLVKLSLMQVLCLTLRAPAWLKWCLTILKLSKKPIVCRPLPLFVMP